MRLPVRYFFSASFFRTYAVWLFLPFLSNLFAVLASTANPLAIALAASSFIGISLLRKPLWNIELVIILGLFISGIVVLFFGGATAPNMANKIVWGVSILGFVALFSAFYKLLTDHNAIKATPIFVWIALFFLLYSIVDTAFQLYSAKELITGFKRYFQMWGLLFALCWMGFSKKNVEHWCAVILIICLLQSPFCLYQYLVLVPIRESYVDMYPGLEPIDVVAGTFGAGMFTGGNNAEMATSLLMVFAILLSRYRASLITGKQLSWLSVILLSPLVMGETKIIIIFLPVMFLVLYRKEMITRPVYGVIALMFGSLFTVMLLNVYMIITGETLDGLIFDTLKYNVYEVGYGNLYLNRTSVLIFWWQHQNLSDPLGFLFGYGLGCAELSGSTSLGGHIDTLYPNYGIGLTGASMLLWELGIFGLVLYILMMITAWQCANRIIKVAVDAKMRADAAAIQASIAIFILYPFYRDSLLNQASFQLIFAFALGYLAWMAKQYKRHKS